jgi:hypothetical protein
VSRISRLGTRARYICDSAGLDHATATRAAAELGCTDRGVKSAGRHVVLSLMAALRRTSRTEDRATECLRLDRGDDVCAPSIILLQEQLLARAYAM